MNYLSIEAILAEIDRIARESHHVKPVLDQRICILFEIVEDLALRLRDLEARQDRQG